MLPDADCRIAQDGIDCTAKQTTLYCSVQCSTVRTGLDCTGNSFEVQYTALTGFYCKESRLLWGARLVV